MTDEENLKWTIDYWCNQIGCADCVHNTFDKDVPCHASVLQHRIMDKEMDDFLAGKAIIITNEI